MEEIKSDEMYMEDLDGWILEENKVVTYKYLSRALDVHVNTAKQMLWSYKESKQGACKGVVYFVSGMTKGSEGKVPETRVSLVKEEKLKETLDSLDKVFSQHVYSIQLSERVSASALYAVDLEVFKEDPMGCCKHVAIKNPLAVPRAAVAPPRIAPGVQMVKKEVRKTGALEGAFAKTKKSSDEPVKSSSVSSVKELKPKVGNSPEKKSLSVNSGSKKAKPGGGIANFFSAKPKTEKPVEKAEKASRSEEKENIENNESTEKEESSKKPASIKKPPVKVETKSFGKKDKEEEDKKVDENKKRKRIQVLSDSEEEDEEEAKEVEEKIVEPPPPQAQLLHSDSEDEEVIPATPKDKIDGASRKGGRRRRVKKQVDKTYVDEDGYMVTKKVVESASETDDETDVAPKPKAEKTVNTVNKKETPEEAPAAKKQKVVVAPGAKKQQGIASFFTKK